MLLINLEVSDLFLEVVWQLVYEASTSAIFEMKFLKFVDIKLNFEMNS